MDSTIIGSIIGFLAAVIAQVFQRWFPAPPPPPSPPTVTTEVKVDVTLPEHEHQHTHIHKRSWVETLRALIRPGITVAFFALFAIIKVVGLFHGMQHDDISMTVLLPVVWDQGAGELLGIIMGFWFGSRLPKK